METVVAIFTAVGSVVVQGVGFEPTAEWRNLPQIPSFSV